MTLDHELMALLQGVTERLEVITIRLEEFAAQVADMDEPVEDEPDDTRDIRG